MTGADPEAGTVSVQPVSGPAELAACYAVRHTVFVVEQSVPPDLERDVFDETALHFLGRVAGVPVATARLVPDPDRPWVGVAGRVAVLPAFRGGGLGRGLMSAVERAAAGLGLGTVELHAQVPVRAFYEQLGYRAVGPEYPEAGIPHVTMTKELGRGAC